jgi:hypothetical protein
MILFEWYNGMDYVICIACCVDICCAFLNAFLNFLMFSNVFVFLCLHLFNMIFISRVMYLSIFVK